MAASVDLTSGGTGGPADLDALVKALDRFTAALQGVAKQAGLGGGDEAAPAGETPGAPAGGMGVPNLAGMFSKFLPPQVTGFATTVASLGDTLSQFSQKLKMGADTAAKLPGVSATVATMMGSFGTKLTAVGGQLVRLLGPVGIGAGIFMLAKKLPVIGDLMEIGIQGVLYPLRKIGSIFSCNTG